MANSEPDFKAADTISPYANRRGASLMPDSMSEFINELINGRNIYILVSYFAGAVVLIGLALFTWRGKKSDENDLRKLEEQIRELSKKQGMSNG